MLRILFLNRKLQKYRFNHIFWCCTLLYLVNITCWSILLPPCQIDDTVLQLCSQQYSESTFSLSRWLPASFQTSQSLSLSSISWSSLTRMLVALSETTRGNEDNFCNKDMKGSQVNYCRLICNLAMMTGKPRSRGTTSTGISCIIMIVF